jgi:hypothetical protein
MIVCEWLTSWVMRKLKPPIGRMRASHRRHRQARDMMTPRSPTGNRKRADLVDGGDPRNGGNERLDHDLTVVQSLIVTGPVRKPTIGGTARINVLGITHESRSCSAILGNLPLKSSRSGGKRPYDRRDEADRQVSAAPGDATRRERDRPAQDLPSLHRSAAPAFAGHDYRVEKPNVQIVPATACERGEMPRRRAARPVQLLRCDHEVLELAQVILFDSINRPTKIYWTPQADNGSLDPCLGGHRRRSMDGSDSCPPSVGWTTSATVRDRSPQAQRRSSVSADAGAMADEPPGASWALGRNWISSSARELLA